MATLDCRSKALFTIINCFFLLLHLVLVQHHACTCCVWSLLQDLVLQGHGALATPLQSRWWVPLVLVSTEVLCYSHQCWLGGPTHPVVHQTCECHHQVVGLFNLWEDCGVCIHMVQDDKQQYNECDDDWRLGSCFLVVTSKRIPGYFLSKRMLCLKRIYWLLPIIMVCFLCLETFRWIIKHKVK